MRVSGGWCGIWDWTISEIIRDQIEDNPIDRLAINNKAVPEHAYPLEPDFLKNAARGLVRCHA